MEKPFEIPFYQTLILWSVLFSIICGVLSLTYAWDDLCDWNIRNFLRSGDLSQIQNQVNDCFCSVSICLRPMALVQRTREFIQGFPKKFDFQMQIQFEMVLQTA